MSNEIRAAAYARYSSDKQTDNSIAYQMQKITEYAQKNDIEIVQFYADEAQSGTNTDRGAFQRLISDAQLHKFEMVIVYEMSRGSRDIGDWFNFRRQMLQLKVEVISVSEKLGSMLDPNAFFMEAITAAKCQLDVLQIRERSIAGTAIKAQQGQFLGGIAPLGYDIVNGEYVINPTESAAVRKIFEMYASGASYNDIIRALNGMTGKRGQPLGKNSLFSILKNERYIGNYTWNKRNVKLLRKWAGGTPNPNVVRIDGIIPQIVDNETWEKVQMRFNDRKQRGYYSGKRQYLLSGLITCGACGGAYCGHTSTNKKGYEYVNYICGNKFRTRTCKNPNIPAVELETYVVQQVKLMLLQTNFDEMAKNIAAQINGASADLSAEKKELAAVQEKISNGVKAVLSGVSFPELTAEMDRLRTRAAELNDIIATAKLSTNKISAEYIKQQLEMAVENWAPENYHEILKQFVTKITAQPDGSVAIELGVVTVNGCGSPQPASVTTFIFVPLKCQKSAKLH